MEQISQAVKERGKSEARQKVVAEPVLKSWGDVDQALAEIGEVDKKIEREADKATRKAAAIQEALAVETQVLASRRLRLVKDIQEYAGEEKEKLVGTTKKLAHGSLGFRKSTKILLKNAAKAIEKLKALNLLNCIRVKETVNKDALRECDDNVLADLGAKKKVEYTFWFEVKKNG